MKMYVCLGHSKSATKLEMLRIYVQFEIYVRPVKNDEFAFQFASSVSLFGAARSECPLIIPKSHTSNLCG